MRDRDTGEPPGIAGGPAPIGGARLAQAAFRIDRDERVQRAGQARDPVEEQLRQLDA